MRLSLKILLWLLFPIYVLGQNFHVSAFTIQDGLPTNQIRHVIQDTYGLVWLATDNGLVRFDGYQFQLFSQQLPSEYGNHLCAFNKSILLSHDAGISRIVPGLDTSLIEPYLKSSIDPNTEELYYPDQLFLDSNKDLWISQANGHISYRKSKEKKEFIIPNTNGKSTTYFAEYSEGIILLGNSKGQLFFYDNKLDKIQALGSFKTINGLGVTGKEIWIASDKVYQLRLSKKGNRIIRQKAFTSPLGEITALHINKEGYCYVGIKNAGIFMLNPDKPSDKVFVKVFSNNDPHRVDELIFKNINNITSNAEGQIFICSDEGFGILQKRFFNSVIGVPNGNTSSITSLEDGKIFVNFGDVYLIEQTSSGLQGIALDAFRAGNVSSLCANGKRLWVGTSNGKLLDVDQQGNVFRMIDLTERGEGIYYMMSDEEKRLWVCQAPLEKPLIGIACLLPNGQLKEYGREKGLDNRILVIKATDKGRLYAGGIGKESYLYRYLPKEDSFLNLSLPFDFYISPNFEVHDLTIDKNGVIWLASTDGLLRYDMDRVRKVDLKSGTESIEVRAVQAMPDGSIWVSTDTEGIIRYDEQGIISIREESGLPSKVMAYRSLLKDQQNRLWVGTAEGLVYSLDTIPKPDQTDTPQLVSLIVDGERSSQQKLAIHSDQHLKITFTCPSFHGYRTFFEARVDDGNWSNPTTQNDFSFTQLEPGKHEIQIRARKEGGSYHSVPLKVKLEVHRHWYQIVFFRWALIAIVVLPILWFLLYKRQSYNKLIANLSRELSLNKARITQREKDLAKAKAEIDQDQKEFKANNMSLDLLKNFVEKVSIDSKWDEVMEQLSIDLLRFPGVTAFEIITKRQNNLEMEGYSELIRGFTSAHSAYSPKASLAAFTLEERRSFIFSDLKGAMKQYLSTEDIRLKNYRSALATPLKLKRRKSVLFIYSDELNYFDEYNLKIMKILSAYLEQISK